ncbi:MAG: hypothetical protein WCW78_04125 [Candidatus Paceibacterota bacterium]|jgi:hypothetical protein
MRTLFIPLFFSFVFFAHADEKRADTTRITIEYDATFDAPQFSLVSVAKLIGILPNRLTLSETIQESSTNSRTFTITLKGDNGKMWVYLNSDSSVYSFISLPFQSDDTLAAPVIRFISNLKEFFAQPEKDRVLVDAFVIGSRHLKASAYASAEPLSSYEQGRFNTFSPKRFDVYTHTPHNNVHIGGNVIIGRVSHALLYLSMKVRIASINTDIILTMRNVSVTTSK